MARRTPQTHAKRQREVAKAEKRREKLEKRALRKSLKSQDPDEESGSENPEVTAEPGPEAQQN